MKYVSEGNADPAGRRSWFLRSIAWRTPTPLMFFFFALRNSRTPRPQFSSLSGNGLCLSEMTTAYLWSIARFHGATYHSVPYLCLVVRLTPFTSVRPCFIHLSSPTQKHPSLGLSRYLGIIALNTQERWFPLHTHSLRPKRHINKHNRNVKSPFIHVLATTAAAGFCRWGSSSGDTSGATAETSCATRGRPRPPAPRTTCCTSRTRRPRGEPGRTAATTGSSVAGTTGGEKRDAERRRRFVVSIVEAGVSSSTYVRLACEKKCFQGD